MRMVAAYLAVGSNLGDRARSICDAVARLSQVRGVRMLKVSTLMENPAVGGPPDAPAYLNGAVGIETELGSHALLHELLSIEQELGRTRRVKWEPRRIDLDLLLYGDQIISSQELIIPHPLMHERAFVLKPLSEIAPDVVHPALQMSIKGLLENISRAG
ncbi:MAG: 2-amino-4-hydroxy-6-hydroxymethyldihydropteridine diphosphokinase [Phycisphaerales bacterium]|nr:2-amino-4-hydroxy-6-hydroxymethyldihydropteridine diphosphokinase [Phycisphaerales bacterium]